MANEVGRADRPRGETEGGEMGARLERRGADGPAVISARGLEGNHVRNPQGDDLGRIEQIMIEPSSGKIAYAVLSFGGFLGVGDKLFAIPWKALALDAEERSFILDTDPEVLKSAPGFDKNNWPDFADREWDERIHAHYRTDPYWI